MKLKLIKPRWNWHEEKYVCDFSVFKEHMQLLNNKIPHVQTQKRQLYALIINVL